MMIKFIYFYSNIYEYYHNHLQSRLRNCFLLEPIKIDDLATNTLGHTFFNGVSIKIELIIQSIRQNMGQYILFSDATIFINPTNISQFAEYIDSCKDKKVDLCFADNLGPDEYNIGFILIHCNDKTLLFFDNVLKDLEVNKGWDQAIINQKLRLSNTGLIIDKFDHRIHCGWTFNPNYKDSFFVFKSFIHHTNNLIENFNKRIHIFYDAKLIDEDEFTKNICLPR